MIAIVSSVVPWAFATRRIRSVCIFFLAGFLLAFAPSAQAEDRVVILEFEGDNVEEFQDAVKKIAKKSVRVIPYRRFRKAVANLDQFRETKSEYRQIAKTLNADGFISGKVLRKRGDYELSLRFRTKSGAKSKLTVTIRSPKATLNSRATAKLRKRLTNALNALNDDDDSDDDESDDDESDDDESDDDESDDDDSDDDESDDDESDDDDEPRHQSVEIDVGLSATSRKLRFNLIAGADTPPPQGYSGGMVPGIYVTASIFPLQSQANLLSGLGITGVADRVLKIESKFDGMTLPTSQARYGAGLVYRYLFSPDRKSGSNLRIAVRYSVLDFTIDKTNAPTVLTPSVAYSYIEPGASLHVVLSPEFSISAGGHYYIIRSTGDISDPEQYGNAAVSGFAGHVGASVGLSPRMNLRIGAQYTNIRYTFSDIGERTDVDGDGQQDISGATDAYLGLLATVEFTF